MTDSTATAIKDSVKGIGGIIGIESIPTITAVQQDDIVRLFTITVQGLIALITLISLLKSLFKNQQS